MSKRRLRICELLETWRDTVPEVYDFLSLSVPRSQKTSFKTKFQAKCPYLFKIYQRQIYNDADGC